MRFLITAGNTRMPIDAVRCITNIFTGRTGTQIALEAYSLGHEVYLLTSAPKLVEELYGQVQHPHSPLSAKLKMPGQSESTPNGKKPSNRLKVKEYQTFAELQQLMEAHITQERWDVIIHSAAVSDYQVKEIRTSPKPPNQELEDSEKKTVPRSELATGKASLVVSAMPANSELVDQSVLDCHELLGKKIKGNYNEIQLILEPTPKLIDYIRPRWGFRGLLVKFKLEVGLDEPSLQAIAKQSRWDSQADFIVANTFEARREWVLIGDRHDHFEKIDRQQLPQVLCCLLELASQEQNQ